MSKGFGRGFDRKRLASNVMVVSVEYCSAKERNSAKSLRASSSDSRISSIWLVGQQRWLSLRVLWRVWPQSQGVDTIEVAAQPLHGRHGILEPSQQFLRGSKCALEG